MLCRRRLCELSKTCWMLTWFFFAGGEPWTKKKKKRKRADSEAAEPQLPGLVGTGAQSFALQRCSWFQNRGLCSGSDKQ